MGSGIQLVLLLTFIIYVFTIFIFQSFQSLISLLFSGGEGTSFVSLISSIASYFDFHWYFLLYLLFLSPYLLQSILLRFFFFQFLELRTCIINFSPFSPFKISIWLYKFFLLLPQGHLINIDTFCYVLLFIHSLYILFPLSLTILK